MERERDIERYLKNKFAGMGCLFLKWVSPGNDGVPDRILIMPDGRVSFVELKTESGHMEGMQIYWQRRLRKMGCNAFTVYGMTGAKELVEVIGILLGKGGGGDEVHTARVSEESDTKSR